MSQTMLVMLTIFEIVALAAVLALFLFFIGDRLRSIADTLGHVARGAATIENHVRQVGPGAGRINKTLGEIVGALPGIAENAETFADIVEKDRARPVPTTQKTRTNFTYHNQ